MTDLFTPRPVRIAQFHAEQFTEEFLAALPANLRVYERFEVEALKVARRGFKHYSARTIIEVLRHHSALEDVDASFKLNDHATPFYARLFALLNPLHKDLFEFRETKSTAGRRYEGATA